VGAHVVAIPAPAAAAQAAVLFDKFHIMRHLGEALDKVRKAEYDRLSGKDRCFIKEQKHTLLSRRDNLSLDEALARAPARRQQAAEHRLPAEGELRPALGLSSRGLGAPLLRQLAKQPQMAAPQEPHD